MSALGGIARSVWDLIVLVAKEFANLAKTPWQFRSYTDACGAPPLPPNVIAQLEGIATRDFSPQALRDALSIFQGIHDAIKLFVESLHTTETAAETADRALEIYLRLFYPILLVSARRTDHLGLYLALTTLAMVDDLIAENLSGFIGERLIHKLVLVDARAAVLQGQPLELALPIALPFVAWLLFHRRVEDPGDFFAGWESDLPAHRFGVADAPRSTPIWMAERTSSIHWVAKPKLTLATYDAPPVPSAVPPTEKVRGFTIVPVPTKSDALAGAGGPAVWFQVDGGFTGEEDLSDILGAGWTIRYRGRGDIGFLLPLSRAQITGDIGFGAGVELELGWAPAAPPGPPPPPSGDDGENGGVDVTLGGAAIIVFGGGGVALFGKAAPEDFGVALRLSKLQISITPKNPVLGALVRTNLSTQLDLGLMWSRKLGLVIEGGSGLDLYLAVRKTIGNSLLGATLSYVRLSGIVDKQATGTKLSLQATMGLELSFLRATLIIDGIGAGVSAESRKPGGNLLGLGHLDGDAIVPSGIGLKLDWGPVKGGGFFSYDRTHNRYSGAVELGLGSWTLRGVGFTEGATPTLGPFTGDSHTTTTLVLLQLEQDIPSPGFSISGIGFLLGLHRTVNAEAMRDALPSGQIDAMMFPSDPLGRTAAIVAALATMFPPAPPDHDTHVAGVLVKTSFAGGYATAKIGFLVQWGTGNRNETKILVPLSIKVGPPGALARVFSLEVLGLGEYDAATGDLEVHAVLRNSRLCGGDLVGGLVVFRGDPDPDDHDRSRGVFVSVGGYHPSYYAGKGPPRARVDSRLGIVIAHGENVKLEVTCYLAFVPSGFHVGVFGHLAVQAGGFGIDGKLWFDGVADYSFDNFTFDLGGSVALILFSRTVAELKLEGELSGQHPWHASGKVSFKLLWWTVSKSFSKDLSDAPTGQVTQADDIRAQLAAAVHDPASYPRNIPGLVSLTRTPRAGIWHAPEQPLAFVQKVAPLDTQIDRVGRTPLAAPLTIHVDDVTIGTVRPARVALTSEFAPAAYLSLDTDAAVRAPVAEQWPAGFSAGDDALAIGDEQPADALLDEITVDRKQIAIPPRRRGNWATLRAAWQATSVSVASAPIRVRPARFASRGEDAAATFADAWRARGTVLRRTEGLG